MKYQLRNFENNFQIINSLGWVFVILSVVLLIIKQSSGFLIFGLFGALLIWIQLRGKRITVDTGQQTIKFGGKTHKIKNSSQIFMKEAKLNQRVNSRTSSSNVKMYFYKAYLKDGDEKILLSSNRKETRDLEKLKAIAEDLGVEFSKNY